MNEPTVMPIRDLEDAESAFGRVRTECEAILPAKLSMLNLDLLTASSVAIGVAPGLQTFRPRLAQLPEFEIRCLDRLEDYAKAVWYAQITNLPIPEGSAGPKLEEEVKVLREKLLVWCPPLVAMGIFSQAAVDKIKEGSGKKDMASDLVSLVTLFRGNWDKVSGICGVSAEDLERAGKIGPAMFAMVSRKENDTSVALSDGALRVRRCWTLLDQAYDQCRRAISYLRWNEGDADTLVPSLRRNSGVRASSPAESPAPAPHVAPEKPENKLVSTGPVVGGGGSPFVRPTP